MNKKANPLYNKTLINFIKKNVFVVNSEQQVEVCDTFKRKIDEFREKGKKSKVIVLGKDGTWLSKELDKWKNKIYPEEKQSFNGTIQNLELLCELTKSTPNDLLLSYDELVDKGGDEIVFITKESIIEFAKQLSSSGITLEEEIILPMKAKPQQMATLLIKFYKAEEKHKNIKVEYVIVEYDPYEGVSASPVFDENKITIVDLGEKDDPEMTLEKKLEEMLANAEEDYRDAGEGFIDDTRFGLSNVMEHISVCEDDMLFNLILKENVVYAGSKSDVDEQIYNAGTTTEKRMER